MKLIIGTIVICFCFAAPQILSQELLTQKTINSSGGEASITNSMNLAFGFTPGPNDHPVPMLFQGLWVTSRDTGHTYVQGPSDDAADFNLYTSHLTDGRISYCCYIQTVGLGGFAESGIPESQFFDSLPPGNNGIDLGGFTIDYYTLVFNTLNIVSPGSNPNGNGNWTDFSYSATFSVYGEPVPEPRSSDLFVALGVPGLLCFLIANYVHRRKPET
jgi:hypothetical protein